jgi:hypothetical protein
MIDSTRRFSVRMHKGYPFMDVEYEGPGKSVPDNAPTFSEAALYPRLGKGDARFVLGVAEEYEHIIEALGPKAVKAVLGVKPRLVQRLGVGEEVTKSLEDARDETEMWRDERYPPQIILDGDAARSIWNSLFDEYRGYYDPEKSMERDQLRALKWLTKALGDDYVESLKEEKEKLPEKLKQQKERKKVVEKKTELRNKLRNAKNDKDRREAVALFQEMWEKGEASIR